MAASVSAAAMKLSVIVSTYNAPKWLEKSLWGYAAQTHLPFELIIADDGSGPKTAELIERMRRQTGLAIRHVWQRDDGFRKCRILNKAIIQATGDYLVFSDGDCIPRRDFLAVHAARAAPGCSLSGGYFKLPMVTSQAIQPDDITQGRCFEPSWLYTKGLQRRLKTFKKLDASPGQARWLNRLTPTRCNFKGSNGSAWREDVLRINGFDERMAYGSEDREFGVRLLNAGVRPRHVRYDAICLHLDHPRGYVDPAAYAWNRQLRKSNERSGIAHTDFGIRQLRAAGYPAEREAS